MDYLKPLVASGPQSQRLHQAFAPARPVSWLDVQVFRVKALRTMVAIAAAGQRQYLGPTVLAFEPSVLISSAHAPYSLIWTSQIRESGSRFLFL